MRSKKPRFQIKVIDRFKTRYEDQSHSWFSDGYRLNQTLTMSEFLQIELIVDVVKLSKKRKKK